MRRKNVVRILLGVALFMILPFIASFTVEGFNWTLFDFVFMYILIAGSGLTYEFLATRSNNTAYRAGVAFAVIAALLLVWINGAVGIIGNEDRPANLLYFGALFIGITGVGIAKFKPRGMAYASFVTAFALALIPAIALLAWPETVLVEEPGVVGVFMLNSFFVMLYILSGLLFRHASTTDSKTEIA